MTIVPPVSHGLGPRPQWLTFDCYGTLIQWDEGLAEAVERIVARHGISGSDATALIAAYHICASPHLDHAAARDLNFRCIWINRVTGRSLLPDYTPDMTLSTLERLPAYFEWIGWMA